MNKKGKVVTIDNYKELVLKKAIVLCWVLLILCFIIKICGGNFFEINCDSYGFSKFCDLIDNTFIKYIIYYIEFLFSSYLLIKIVDSEFNKTIIYFLLCSVVWVIKLLIEIDIIQVPTIIQNIFEFVVLYIIFCILTKKPLKSIMCILLLFTFSMISALTKNISLSSEVTESFVLSQIFAIDYYIMLILSALYSKILFKRS